MREKIGALALRIKSSYERLGSRAAALRDSDPSLALRMERAPLSASVCAVDGGLLSRRLHGADIAVVRSVGVNFVYEGSRLASFAHSPAKSPEPEIEMRDSLDEHESLSFRSLVRLRSELRCAIECVERFSPGALLLDGSLLPLPNDRPAEGSELGPLYSEVLSLYMGLRKATSEKSCLLIGVIKDSRSRKMARDLGFPCSDGTLCGFLLDEGERSGEMPYYEEKPNKDLAALAENVSVFYMRPSALDLPLRIECAGADVGRAASLVYSLCSVSDSFAYPSILVEADMCAALEGKEMERIEGSLMSLSGLRPLRRDSRPFR
jgi:hypothetical protein